MDSDSVKYWVQKGPQKSLLPILGALTMSAAERKSATTAPPLHIRIRRRTFFSKGANASAYLSLTAAITFAPSSKKKTSSTSSSPLQHNRVRHLIFLHKYLHACETTRERTQTRRVNPKESIHWRSAAPSICEHGQEHYSLACNMN